MQKYGTSDSIRGASVVLPAISPLSPVQFSRTPLPSPATLNMHRESTSFTVPALPRLFVGLELPAPVSASISSLVEPARLPGARWLPASSWHITLHFLGATLLDEVRAALERVRSVPFTARIRDIRTFGSKTRPRVLWAGVPMTPELTALHSAVGLALSGAGFEVDKRPYIPHVSLAKLTCRKDEDAERVNCFVRDSAQFVSPAFRVDSFTLFESVMSEGGPVYWRRGRYPLTQRK